LSPAAPRLLVSCGEPSGDLYGGELLRHLRGLRPGTTCYGLGGDRLAGQGAEILAHVRDLAVVGLVEVVSRLAHLRRVYRRVLAEVDRRPPDLAVLIDYAGFNLRLAEALHRRGVPVAYYVSPQVWAWRRGRIRTMRRTLRRMLVIFPFEEALYREEGVPVTFVGHPLVDLVEPAPDRHAFLASAGLDPARPVVAVLPGSRVQEIRRNLPPLRDSITRLQRRRPDLQFLVAGAPSLDRTLLEPQLEGVSARLVMGETHAALGAAVLALVASGTATVEAALLGTPMVVVYRVSPWSYALGRRLVRVPHYAMVNLIAGRRVVPELIQAEFTPARVEAEALSLVEDPARLEGVRGDLREVRRRLGSPGASRRAAETLLELLPGPQPTDADKGERAC
jgi:lipid-A-disaccharide synthase